MPILETLTSYSRTTNQEGVTLAWDNLSVYVNIKRKRRLDIKRIINSGKIELHWLTRNWISTRVLQLQELLNLEVWWP